MSIEKKSLINNMTATKKALIATTPASPVVSGNPSPVGLSKKFSKTGNAAFSKKFSKTGNAAFSKKFSKTGNAAFSKKFSKTGNAAFSKKFSKI